MPVKWNPAGFLNVAADPSDLPSVVKDSDEASGALTRCTNLHLDEAGKAKTRAGSAKLNTTAIATPIWHLREMNGDRFAFAGTQIYKNEESIASGYTSAQWDSVLYNAFNITTESVFAANGSEQVKVDADGTVTTWGVAEPTTAPTIRTGTLDSGQAGTDWGVKYTFCVFSGTTLVAESNPSTAAATPATDGDVCQVTWTASSDSRVTHVRVYRTTVGGAEYLLMDTVAIGTTRKRFVVADSALGSAVSLDHDVPPAGLEIIAGPDYNGYLFGAAGDHKVYFCSAKQPEYWPATNFVECGSSQHPVRSIQVIGGQIYVITDVDIWLLQGTGVNTFFPYRQNASTGCLANHLARGVRGRGLFRVASDGVWVWGGSEDTQVSDAQFRPVYQGTTSGSIRGVNSTYRANGRLVELRGKLYHFFPGGENEYNSDVLALDLDTKQTVHYQFSAIFSEVGSDETNTRLIAGDTSGYVWALEDPANTDDAGTDISWQIQSKDYTDQLRRYMPRYARWDVDAGSATGTVLLDGTAVQTHSITTRQPKKRLVDGNNGTRVALRVSGTGAATIYGAEVE